MPDLWDAVIAIFNTVTTFFSAHWLFSLFSEKSNKRVLLMLAGCLVFTASPLFIDDPYINMAVLAGCVFLIASCYSFSVSEKILFSLLFVAVNIVAELITGLFIMLLFSIDKTTATENVIYNSMGVLLSKFAVTMVLMLASAIKRPQGDGSVGKHHLPLLLLPISTIFTTVAVYSAMDHFGDNEALKTLSLFCMAFLIASNMYIVKLICDIRESVINEEKLKIAEELIKKQEQQYKDLLESNGEVRKLRHDFKNMLLGLISDVKIQQPDAVRSRLEKELELLDKADDAVVCGNSVIDTVINCKRQRAKNIGADIEFTYKNVHLLCIEGTDVSVLLGNAIDNALEATEKLCDEADKKINVHIFCNEKQMIASVKNNVFADVNTKKLETTKNARQLHGFGIMSMQHIAEKYGGSVTFDCKNKVFTATMILNNTKE